MENKEKPMLQTIILFMADGRKLQFTGPAGIKEGDKVIDLMATQPVPLPPDCNWENLISDSKGFRLDG